MHQGDNFRAFVLFKEGLTWQCHTHACHGTCKVADIFDLIRKLRCCSFNEAVEFVKAVYNVGEVDQAILDKIEFEEGLRGLSGSKRESDLVSILPNELVDLYQENGAAYYQSRGFSADLLSYFQVGFCPDDLNVDDDLMPYVYLLNEKGEPYLKPYFHDRCVIPIHDRNGGLVGFSGRSVSDLEPKFIYTPNLPKTKVLYNWHRAVKFVDTSKELVICESPGVVWSWFRAGFPNVVATLGAYLSQEQARMIFKAPNVNKVTIAYDADKAGREGAKAAIKSLIGKVNVYAIDLPEYADYDKMSPAEIQSWFNKRRRSDT